MKGSFAKRIAIAFATVALSLGGAAPARADTSASTTATINIAVRSVTVSPASTTFDSCVTSTGVSTGTNLVFPNGTCFTNGTPVTITNGPAPSHIDVQGSSAVPSDGGTHWTLCNGTTIACTGSDTAHPGVDQFREDAQGGPGLFTPSLTNSPQCDTGFATSCAAAPGQATTETLRLGGPSASTDNSLTFTTVWTWTAAP